MYLEWVMEQYVDQESSRWGSIAVGLLGIATVLAGATAVGGFEVATE